MIRFLLAASAALGAALALGACGGTGGDSSPSAQREVSAEMRARLKGSPPALARLHAQAGKLLGGGKRAFAARLRELRGHPIVVNNWASWCGPCRAEMGLLRRTALSLGRRVAFIGVDSEDSASQARQFMAELPVPYPSYSDQDKQISDTFNRSGLKPSTAFYNRRGRRTFVHLGQYRDAADLRADIRRYAGA